MKIVMKISGESLKENDNLSDTYNINEEAMSRIPPSVCPGPKPTLNPVY